MVKKPTSTDIKINITLKDGTEYLGKDIPEKPFGEHDRIVGFWEGEALILIPISEVKRVALCFS
jgi:hypothetical protein